MHHAYRSTMGVSLIFTGIFLCPAHKSQHPSSPQESSKFLCKLIVWPQSPPKMFAHPVLAASTRFTALPCCRPKASSAATTASAADAGCTSPAESAAKVPSRTGVLPANIFSLQRGHFGMNHGPFSGFLKCASRSSCSTSRACVGRPLVMRCTLCKQKRAVEPGWSAKYTLQ